ncbi:predicted protein [Verticillium alfalfae VaMs.102]|uniref:Predicted protein n=1 Tax=Verticillium alfalfae (strain VaMs.102 / ATCC MYA-4576 / FGSC 10136) TaxID=526221 RepID=C9STD2_VERA1|nr:predicted protein [Verticillium alfalfae VaMs.102]EEY22047.1 predicted protein [Verticillium alfalfae VaMs.102]
MARSSTVARIQTRFSSFSRSSVDPAICTVFAHQSSGKSNVPSAFSTLSSYLRAWTILPASGAATRAHDDQKGDEVDGHSFASSAARHTCPLYLHPDTRLNRAPVALLITGHTTVPLSHVYLPVARDAAWWSAVQLPPLWKSRRQRP